MVGERGMEGGRERGGLVSSERLHDQGREG